MTEAETKTRPTLPASGHGRRGRGAPAMKLLGSLRGRGVLLSEAGETPVSYQLDVFQGGAGRSGSGTLDGDMPAFPEDSAMEARLRLAGGREVAVSLQAADERGAMFDTRGEVPLPE